MLNTITLSSELITLEPLTLRHELHLTEAIKDGNLWQNNMTSVPSPDELKAYIVNTGNSSHRVAFAVINNLTGRAIGSTSLYNILPLAKRLEIGYTWYAKSFWRTHVNTTCKFMLLEHTFETLNYLTVGWRTDIDNIQSQHAIERIGANKDCIIRGDRVRRNGVISNSMLYSMTIDEWPKNKAKLLERLSRYH